MQLIKKLTFSILVFSLVTIIFADSVIIESKDGSAPIAALINNAKSSVKLSIYQLITEPYPAPSTTVIPPTPSYFTRPVLNALVKANNKSDVKVEIIVGNFTANGWPASGIVDWNYENTWATTNSVSMVKSSIMFSNDPTYDCYAHNKYMIIDDKKVVIMTGNLTTGSFVDTSEHKIRNFYVVVEDTASVSYMKTLFAQDLKNSVNGTATTPPNIPSNLLIGPNTANITAIADFISNAENKIDIYMMYFDNDCPAAIFSAIKNSDATIRILLSNLQKQTVLTAQFPDANTSDSNITYKIIPSSNPLFIHTKTFIRDGSSVLLGSMNMSATSLNKNREVDMISSSTEVVSPIQTQFDTDWNSVSVQTQTSQPKKKKGYYPYYKHHYYDHKHYDDSGDDN